MPQLDFLILQSQINFLLIFFLGYFFFLKFVLPWISFLLKIKYKLIISNLQWFQKNFYLLVFYKRSFLISLWKINSFLKVLNFFKFKRFIFFNLYLFDYLIVRKVFDHINKNS